MFSVSQTMQYMNEKDSSCRCYIINKQIKSDTNMFPLSILMPKVLLFCCTFVDQILASKLVICMKTLCQWAMPTMLHRSVGLFRVLFLLFSSFFQHKKWMTSFINNSLLFKSISFPLFLFKHLPTGVNCQSAIDQGKSEMD